MVEELYKIDGVLWNKSTVPKPYCPKHKLEMDAYTTEDDFSRERKFDHLKCEDCPDYYVIPRDISHERTYIYRKLQSRELKNIKVLNLDDEAIPIAQDKIKSNDGKYVIKSILTESKVGKRLVVYVCEVGSKEKTQIFVEPSLKRLAFDQNDIHPSEVFIKLEGTFKDGSSMTIKKSKK